MMMEKVKQLFVKYKELISYGFWGGMTTVVNWVSYMVCYDLLGEGLERDINVLGTAMSLRVTVANILAWVLAVIFAFVTNKIWVFGSKSWKPSVFLPELWKFISARLITFALEAYLVPLFCAIGLDAAIFGKSGMGAKLLVSVVVIILNYVFSKLLVFKEK